MSYRIFIAVSALLLLQPGLRPAFGGTPDTGLKKAVAEFFPASDGYQELSPSAPSAKAPQVWRVQADGMPKGYAVSLFPVSKSGSFRVLVVVSMEETVMAVKILSYPHRMGRAVRKSSFLKQFEGTAYGAPLSLGKEVDGISGATSSASALTRSVRQALILVHRYK